MVDSAELIRAAVAKRNAYAQAYQAAFDEKVESLLYELAQLISNSPILRIGETEFISFRRSQFETIIGGTEKLTYLSSEEVLDALAERLSKLGVTLTVIPLELRESRDIECSLYIPATH